MNNKTKDFVFSFVLFIVGIYATIESIAIYRKVAGPPYNIDSFYLSPGFIPAIIGCLIAFFTILLLVSSIKDSSIRERGKEVKTYIENNIHNKDYVFTIGGVLIMAVYSFIFMELLPFWLASLIFLIALMLYLRAGKWWKTLIIAVAAVAITVFIFKYCFNAALP